MEDLDFDGLTTNSSIYIAAQGTGAVSNWTFRRCLFHNAGANRNGLIFQKESGATTATASGLYIFDSEFYDNGQHGLISIGASIVRVRKSKAYRNGFNAGTGGGHGFSSRWNRTDVTSGWTLVSGTIYKRTLSSAENAETIGYVQTPIANKQRLTKNTSTPTTPGNYEFGVSGGELYINVATNPNGLAIRYAFHRCTDLLYEDCSAYLNYVNNISQYMEGNGFAFDDFTDTSIIRRCKSYSNQGRGISINRGDSNVVEDSACYDNGLTGLSSNTSNSTVIRRSTFAYNGNGNSVDSTTTSEMYFSPQATVAISQSVLAAKPRAPKIIDDDNFSTVTVDKCSLSGALTVSNAITPTNPITGDPKITLQGGPMVGSPLIGAGTATTTPVRDVNRVQRKKTPTIGAYDLARRITYPALV
jgi:hypothetical protein